MRRLRFSTYLLVLFLSPMGLLAQAPKLAISDPVPTTPSDTLYFNSGAGDSVISYDIHLVNVGGLAATGLVDIMFEYNGNITHSKLTLLVDLESNQFLDTTITDTVKVWPGEARYGGGVNIIVIWPKAEPDMMAQDPDTALGGIYIDGWVGRDKPQPILDRIDVFPNPAKDVLKIRYKKAGARLEFVRIYDSFGREVYQETTAVSEISLLDQAPGLYFVEFKFRDGVMGIFKMVINH